MFLQFSFLLFFFQFLKFLIAAHLFLLWECSVFPPQYWFSSPKCLYVVGDCKNLWGGKQFVRQLLLLIWQTIFSGRWIEASNSRYRCCCQCPSVCKYRRSNIGGYKNWGVQESRIAIEIPYLSSSPQDSTLIMFLLTTNALYPLNARKINQRG